MLNRKGRNELEMGLTVLNIQKATISNVPSKTKHFKFKIGY